MAERINSSISEEETKREQLTAEYKEYLALNGIYSRKLYDLTRRQANQFGEDSELSDGIERLTKEKDENYEKLIKVAGALGKSEWSLDNDISRASIMVEWDAEEPTSREKMLGEYKDQMIIYQDITRKMRALERRYPSGARDEATLFEISEMDNNRHQNHLKLIEIAVALGKTKEDVLVDIIRWDNSLEDYGLPEFSILKSSDIIDTKGFHTAVQFNVDEHAGRPSDPEPLNLNSNAKENETPIFSDDKILLIFSINPVSDYGELEEYPEDFDERVNRAELLADEVNGEYFDNYQGGSHDTSAHIIGVLVPKRELGEVAQIIRDNPKKFRLGAEFYQK